MRRAPARGRDVIPIRGGPGRPGWLPCLVFVLLALLFRVGHSITTYSRLDADQAIIGIMASAIQAGDRPIFYYGQSYQGSAEAYAAAAAFAVFGDGTLATRAPALLCSAAFVGAIYWLGTLLYGRRNGTFSALYLALGPPILLISTISCGFGYTEVMLCGTLLLILAHRYPDPRGMPLGVALACGLLAGVGLWMQPLMLEYLVPWGALLLTRLRTAGRIGPGLSSRRLALGLAAGALVGACPLLIYNLHYPWATLSYLRTHGAGGNHLGAAVHLVTRAFPVLVGTLPPTTAPRRFDQFAATYPLRHLVGMGLGLLALACLVRVPVRAIEGLAHAWGRSNRGAIGARVPGHAADLERALGLLALCCLLSFIASNFGTLPGATSMPRYLAPLYTVTPLIVHRVSVFCGRLRCEGAAVLGVGALIVLNVAAPGMASLPPAPATAVAGITPDPPAIDGLIRLLEARRIRVAYVSYWLAYRLTYESGGRVRGIPVKAAFQLDFVRTPRDLAFAARLPAHALAWIFDSGSVDERAFRLLLRRLPVRASSQRWATLTVYSGLSHPVRAPVGRVPALPSTNRVS